MATIFNREQIQEIIPHRDPFLLIDEIIEMDGNKITGMKYVKAEEYYFEGHFPQEKVMPGVLQVEALAQVGAVAILSMPEHKGKVAYLASVKEAKFPAKVTPGDTLRLEMTLERLRSKMGTGSGVAYLVDENGEKGKIACQCQMMFMLGQV